MALVHEHEQVALGAEVLGQRLLQLRDEALEVVVFVAVSCRLPCRRTCGPGNTSARARRDSCRWPARAAIVSARLGAVDLPLTPLKTFSICSSSSVRSVMIRTRDSLDVLANPLRQPHHGQALPLPLRVPQDAALATADMILRSAHARSTGWGGTASGAGVKDDEVVDQLERTAACCRSAAGAIQRRVIRAIVPAVKYPRRRGSPGFQPGRSSFQVRKYFQESRSCRSAALGVAAGHDVLYGRKEGLDEFLLLVVEVLADALATDVSSASAPGPRARCR